MTTRPQPQRLRDHVITCNQRFQQLEQRIHDLEREIQVLHQEIQTLAHLVAGHGRPGVVAGVAVAVILAAVLVLAV